MTIHNNPAALTLSAESRAKLRDVVKRHPDWQDYRAANDLDMSQIATKEKWAEVCNALQIDIASTLAGQAPLAAPVQQAEQSRAQETTRHQASLFTPKQQPRPAPVAPVKQQQAPAHTGNAAADLFAALQNFAKEAAAPVDMEQVNAAIDEAVKRANVVRIEVRKVDEVRVMEGRQHPKAATLMRALSARQTDGSAPNVWLAGPAGSGKTHAAKSAAKALGVAFHYNGALSMPHELLGFIDAAGHYHRTPFREAYEHGGVYLFDEVDGSDNSALLALNAALANGRATFPDGQIERHADCYIIATANTWGLGAGADYVGRSKIDAAFLSRFPVRIGWDYDEELEQAICGNAAFAKLVQKARAKARAAGLKVLIDPRASMAGAALIAAGMTDREAAECTYLANLTAEQTKMVEG